MKQNKSILALAGPIAISFWMRAAFTLVDTIYASTLGDAAVAAIGLSIPFEFIMIAFWVGSSTGLTATLAKALGAQEHGKFDQYLRCGWKMVLSAVPLFALVGVGIWFVAPHMDLEPEVMKDFQIYGAVLIGGSAFTGFWAIIPDSLVKVYQDTKTTMWAGIFSNILNVLLNTFFLFVLHWGIFGIALSTVIGRLGGLAYASRKAWQYERVRCEDATHPTCEPDPRPFRSIFRLAIPASITFVLMATEPGIINYLLSFSPNATEAIAAYSIFYRVVMFSIQPILAIGVALLPFTALHYGRKDFAQIRTGLKHSEWTAILYSILFVAPIAFFFAPYISNFLSESPQTSYFATYALYLTPFSCLLGAQFLICRPIFEGMQKAQPGLILAVVRYVFLTAPLAWLGMVVAKELSQPLLFGILGGLLLTSLIASIAFSLWLKKTLERCDPPSFTQQGE